MPYIEIKTNVKVEIDHEEFLSELTTISAKITQAPENMVAVSFVDSTPLFFGGSKDPSYVVNVVSFGLTVEKNKNISSELSKFLKDKLGVENNRGYIFFFSPEKSHIGYGGNTFA